MGTKAVTKKELAELIGVSESTLRRYLNKDILHRIEPLGYKRHCQKISGKALKFILDFYCVTD